MLRLEEIRKAKGLSQIEVANAIGMTQAYVSGLESGKKSPSFETLVKLARALDCTLDDLVETKAALA